MSNIPFTNSTLHRLKKYSTVQQQATSTSYTPKLWPKKTLTIQTDSKYLRQTDTTLMSSPKNTKSIQPNDFQFIKLLGNGKFGSVYLTRHIQTGFIFAMKVIKKANIQAQSKQQTNKIINQLIREIKIQMFLSHSNLIKIYSFFSDQYKIYLLLELASDGELYQYMKDGSKFSQQSVSFLIRQILLGVHYMHQHHVIHRDIKPQNVVVIHGIPKICDFGWSVHCPKQFRNTLCGTPLYLSPEILMGDSYNEKIDTWAIGTLTYQLFTGQNPFKITKKSQMSKIVTQKFVMQAGSISVKDFISSALQKQPQKRMTSKMMLDQPFITKYAELQTCQQLCKKVLLNSKKNIKKIKPK